MVVLIDRVAISVEPTHEPSTTAFFRLLERVVTLLRHGLQLTVPKQPFIPTVWNFVVDDGTAEVRVISP